MAEKHKVESTGIAAKEFVNHGTITSLVVHPSSATLPSASAPPNADIPTQRGTASPQSFISYATRDRAIAELIQGFIENRFPSLGPIFVADSAASIPVGTDWLATINAALRSVRILFVLANEASLSSRWVNFEIGAAWVRDIPIVFLCYDGTSPGSLPSPYNTRQSFLLSAEDPLGTLRRLSEDIAAAMDLEPMPGLKLELFADGLARRLGQIPCSS